MTKKRLVKYTSRDFDSIKADLVDYAKRYYPENYKDFNESSFGSMMLDAVSYVGDIMSFYLDYQVNESFLETALEPSNIRRIAKQYGYKYYGLPPAYGTATFYVIVPAATSGLGPNMNYVPILSVGSKVQSSGGVLFILTEDVDFSNVRNEIVAARFNNVTGKPTYYAIRASGQIKSGNYYTQEISIGPYERNRRVKIGDSLINSIISVIDSEGHVYYEVDNLSQDIVYIEVVNKNAKNDGVRSILKPYKVPRRFVLDQDSSGTYLQFGFGSDNESTVKNVVDPASVALKMNGKNYITDTSFDPKKLLDTNKLGISPSDTTLRIIYGKNTSTNVGVSAGQLNTIISADFKFPDETILTNVLKNEVKNSIEVTNESIIAAETAVPSTDEVRMRSYATYAAQNRAVTKNDYEALIYLMPKKFGSVKRASIINDPSSTNRKLSLYIISEDQYGHFTSTHNTVKTNLKTWLNKNRMINDSIEMFDTKIINITMDYTITVDPQYDKYGVLANINNKIKSDFLDQKMFVGEPLYISQLYQLINNVDGVIDTKKIKFDTKSGNKYSNTIIAIQDIYSDDGSYLKTPKNAVLEIKFPDNDIRGSVR